MGDPGASGWPLKLWEQRPKKDDSGDRIWAWGEAGGQRAGAAPAGRWTYGYCPGQDLGAHQPSGTLCGQTGVRLEERPQGGSTSPRGDESLAGRLDPGCSLGPSGDIRRVGTAPRTTVPGVGGWPCLAQGTRGTGGRTRRRRGKECVPESAAPRSPGQSRPGEVRGGSWQTHCVRGLQTSGTVTEHREVTARGARGARQPPAGRGGAPREILLFLGLAELGSGGQSTQIVWGTVTGEQGGKGKRLRLGQY